MASPHEFLTLLAIAGLCAFPSALTSPETDDGLLMMARFEQWVETYKRSYSSEEERLRRFEVYKSNVKYIEASNSEPELTYELGENAFTDLTEDEFLAMYTGLAPGGQPADDGDDGMVITTHAGPVQEGSATPVDVVFENLSAVPARVDWREKGAVTEVKNQGSCGSCWAFSAVAAIESLHKIKKGKLISLSEQEVVDCDNFDGGCSGGWYDRAFRWIIKNGGITTGSDYPYIGKGSTCNKNKLPHHATTIKDYRFVPSNNEKSLMDAAAQQPISVAIEARGSFQHYKSGIYNGPCGTFLNHAVTVVGYGADARGVKYWIVKNSWGVGWGEGGYIRMHKDINESHGLCGIAMRPAYPTM